MANIVWNLRNDVSCISDIGCSNELCNQAADEIERLRKVLDNFQQSRILQGKAITDASNEIERLRTALLLIRDMGPMTIDDQRWRIAKEALEVKP